MTVKQKQCLLAYLGYYTGTIDGSYGPLTQGATEAFQRAYQLTVDGKFGPATEKRILEVIASGEEPQQAPEKTGTFWDEIKYFDRSEFACPCGRCGGFPAEPKEKLVRLADQAREHFGSVADVSSGVRCQAHNDEIPNSAQNSRHLYGEALDYRIRDRTGAEVLAYVKTLPGVRYAYNIDGTYIHMDIE